MTHDELLAKIDEALCEGSYTFTISKLSELLAQGKALRAVVELHKPDSNYCDACEWQHAYPCPTTQAIEKELK